MRRSNRYDERMLEVEANNVSAAQYVEARSMTL